MIIFYHAFFLFLNYWVVLLIPAVITQIFNPIAEPVVPIGIPIKEAKAETETQTAEIDISKH